MQISQYEVEYKAFFQENRKCIDVIQAGDKLDDLGSNFPSAVIERAKMKHDEYPKLDCFYMYS